jgi:hypothetical protein
MLVGLKIPGHSDFDGNAGGLVKGLDCGVGLVDGLTARPAALCGGELDLVKGDFATD